MKTNPDTNNLPNGTEVNIQIKKTHRIEFLFLLLASISAPCYTAIFGKTCWPTVWVTIPPP